MMPASENGTRLLGSLKRLLPNVPDLRKTDAALSDAMAAALESGMVGAFGRHSLDVRFNLLKTQGTELPQEKAEGIICLGYSLEKPQADLWVDTPVALVKAAFVAGLGGSFDLTLSNADADLTASERHFAVYLAKDIGTALAETAGPVVFNRLSTPGESMRAEDCFKTHSLGFLAPAPRLEGVVTVRMPLQPAAETVPQAPGPRLAGAAAMMLASPEVRLPLRSMTLSELAALKQGDIICAFETYPSVAAQVLIEGRSVFACEVGRSGDRYSARILGADGKSADGQNANTREQAH